MLLHFQLLCQKFAIVVLAERQFEEPDSIPTEVQVWINDTTIIQGRGTINFGGHLRSRGITEIEGLVIPVPGALRINVLVDGVAAGEWRIRVNNIGQGRIVPQPQSPGNAVGSDSHPLTTEKRSEP
jgi:hypothetical protein